jgi:hypothetical protein
MRYRIYQYNIRIFAFYRKQGYSRVYSIPEGRSAVLPGIPYSILALFLGFWTIPHLLAIVHVYRGWKVSAKSIAINIQGGIDWKVEGEELQHNERSNSVYRNLLNKTKERISRNDLDVILELQDESLAKGNEKYSAENSDFLNERLSKIDIRRLERTEMADVFDAIKLVIER